MSDPSAVVSAPIEVVQTPTVEVAPPEPASVAGYEALKEEATPAPEGRFIPVRDKKFRIAESLPGIILLDLGLASDPNATQGEQLRAVRQFLHAAIHETDVELFEVYLRTARPTIEMEELNKIVEKLVEETAGRPTE